MKKDDVAALIAPSTGKCCQETCGSYTCTTEGFVKKKDTDRVPEPTEEKCCEGTCAAHTCSTAGWVKKDDVDDELSPTEAKCCEATCAAYTCQTAGWLKKDGVASELSPAEDKCCEATCASHTCQTSGWVKKGGVEKVLEPTEAKCCEGTCASYTCQTSGFVKKSGVEKVLEPAEAKCCEATCASYSCTTGGFVKKSGVDSVLAPTEDKCCEATCGYYTCTTTGYVKKANVATVLQPTEAKCCEATCTAYTCQTSGWVKKNAVGGVLGPTEGKCCEATCAAYTCATNGWVKKAGVNSMLTPNENKCCEATCGSYTCTTENWVKKQNVATVLNPNENRCCEATCGAFSCPYGHKKKDDVGALIGPSKDKCCNFITSIPPFDCQAHPGPLQLLWNESYGYTVEKFVPASGTYSPIYTIPYSHSSPAYKFMNSVGINPLDSIPYGCLLLGDRPSDLYIVRFNDEKFEYLVKIPGAHDPIAGTFTSTGQYFWIDAPEDQYKDPILYSTSDLNTMVGYANPSQAPTWSNYQGFKLTDFRQIADIVPLKYDIDGDGKTNEYIMGMNREMEAAVIEWGGADSKVWKFSTDDVLDRKKHLWNFGAAWNFENRIFFSSNDGIGVFEAVKIDLQAMDISLAKVGNSQKIYNNDGFNCWNVNSPFPSASLLQHQAKPDEEKKSAGAAGLISSFFSRHFGH